MIFKFFVIKWKPKDTERQVFFILFSFFCPKIYLFSSKSYFYLYNRERQARAQDFSQGGEFFARSMEIFFCPPSPGLKNDVTPY